MADFTQYTDANGTTHTVKDAKAVRQFSTMPSASDYSGLFVVYTGATTSDYTKGHRYLSDGTNWTDYGTAENMSYDNSTSGLSATDVQGAVDELEEEKVSYDVFGAEKTATITDGVATFTAYEEAPVTELVVGIEPVQEGSGTPSPNNVRPISGHTEANISSYGNMIYAFHIDGSEDDPSDKVTYLEDAEGLTPAGMDYGTGTFDYGSWEHAFFMPRPCMLNQSGIVDYYLDPDDYSKKVDGTASDIADTSYAGNAMMEWGNNGRKIWMKIVPDDGDPTSATVYIANYKADSEYKDDSFHNANGVAVNHFYTPIYNGSLVNGTMRSMSGQTVIKSLTAAAERTAAQANNVDGDDIWDVEVKSDIDLITALLVLIGKSTNSQAVFGQGLTTGGTETINDGFTTGVHNAKGLFYGTNSGAASTYTNAVKVFGMENFWGFQWRRYIGHIMINGTQYVKNTYGTEDGSSVEGYNLTGSGYKAISGATPTGTSGQYCDKYVFSADGLFPKDANNSVASASQYYCDGFWFNNSITSVPQRGGGSGYGFGCGLFYAYLAVDASVPWWDIGCAVSCKPLVVNDGPMVKNQGKTVTKAFGQTVYGGELNVRTGVLTVDRASVTLTGDNVYSISSASTTDTEGGKRINTNITDAKYESGTVTAIADRLAWINDIYSKTDANVINVNSEGRIVLRFAGAATVEDAQTALNNTNIQVCYKLATPTTVQLTREEVFQIIGENNISADTGDVISCKYVPIGATKAAENITYNNATSGLDATDVQGAIDELASEKQDVLTFDTEPTEDSTNPVTSGGVYSSLALKTFFGNNGKFYSTTATSLNTLINETIEASSYFSIDNVGVLTDVTGTENHQLIFGWCNQSKLYAWCLILCFGKCYIARRFNSSTFNLTEIGATT